MFGTQNIIYCGDCHISVLAINYTNHIRSQEHIKNQYNNSKIIKHIIIKDK